MIDPKMHEIIELYVYNIYKTSTKFCKQDSW